MFFVLKDMLNAFVLHDTLLVTAEVRCFFLIITIILIPKLRPWAKNYIDSEYLLDIGLGIVIFICTIFIILMIFVQF